MAKKTGTKSTGKQSTSTKSTGQTVKAAYGLANRIAAQAQAKANTSQNASTNNKNTFTETTKQTDTTQNVKDYSELANNFNAGVTQKVNAAKEKGKNTYTGYDKNGALHYTTLGQDRLDEILNYYNNTETPSYSIGGVNYVITPENSTAQSNSQKEQTYDEQAAIQAAIQAAQQYVEQYTPSVDFMSVYNQYVDSLKSILQQQKDALSQSATTKARSAYVSNERNKMAIPQVLSNAGITGGLAEKIRTNQNTSYQQNLANILSENATQGAELERNNANLISEAYKEAMSNQQSVENERSLAAQQYANQVALQQQQQAYEAERQKQSSLMSELQNAASNYTNILNNKGKLVSSTANQLSALKKDLASRGADAATLAAADSYIVAAASARYDQVYGSKKNPSMTKEEYLQKYAYGRM